MYKRLLNNCQYEIVLQIFETNLLQLELLQIGDNILQIDYCLTITN